CAMRARREQETLVSLRSRRRVPRRNLAQLRAHFQRFVILFYVEQDPSERRQGGDNSLLILQRARKRERFVHQRAGRRSIATSRLQFAERNETGDADQPLLRGIRQRSGVERALLRLRVIAEQLVNTGEAEKREDLRRHVLGQLERAAIVRDRELGIILQFEEMPDDSFQRGLPARQIAGDRRREPVFVIAVGRGVVLTREPRLAEDRRGLVDEIRVFDRVVQRDGAHQELFRLIRRKVDLQQEQRERVERARELVGIALRLEHRKHVAHAADQTIVVRALRIAQVRLGTDRDRRRA